jgi:V/A-type H+-transporting ATPase subunit E
MEMDLNNIIEKIKQEGVDEAEKKAADIVKEAENKAQNVLQDAGKQKESILKKAEQDAQRLKDNGEEAVKQASRDVLLSLRERIVELFDKIIKKEIAGQLSGDVIKDMVVKLADKFERGEQPDIEILLSDKEKKDLEKEIFSALGKEVKKGLTIKTSSSIEHGFRIGEKDKHSYYDFTDEAIAEAFMTHLNPKIVEILTKDKGK